MRKLYVLVLVMALSLVTVSVVAADQFVLIERDSDSGGVETVVYDSDTDEVIVTVDGTVVPVDNDSRFRAAGKNALRNKLRQNDQFTLEAILADIEQNPSVLPDLLRIEAALLLLAER